MRYATAGITRKEVQSMPSERWRVELVEDTSALPALWSEVPLRGKRSGASRRIDLAAQALLSAMERLCLRSSGPGAWAAPFRDNPIAFLLDAMSDAVNIWGPDGKLVYRNSTAEHFGVGQFSDETLVVFSEGGHRFERRCLRFQVASGECLLEIIRETSE